MPWHIETDNAECDGYGVVKDATGELVGCHRTRTQAENHLAALYASEPNLEEDRVPGYEPNAGMVAEAERGLAWRDEYGRGGTEIGVARARDIANRRALSLDTVNRMVSYFARHEVDKQGQGWSPDQDGYPSAGRIAWALWGGDPGRTWAEAIANQNRAAGDPPAIVTDIDGTLLLGDSVNQALVQTLDESDAEIIVLTARDPDQRAQTETRLNEIGLEYNELYMVGGEGDDVTAKVAVMRRLLERFDVIAAYENREDIRAAYTDLGVDARAPRSNRAIAEEILARFTRVR